MIHAMTLRESLDYLADELVSITLAPDRYASPHMTYELNKKNILKYWSDAREKVKRDLDQIAPIEALMDEMFTAFESGKREKGMRLAMSLWKGGQIRNMR